MEILYTSVYVGISFNLSHRECHDFYKVSCLQREFFSTLITKKKLRIFFHCKELGQVGGGGGGR